MPAASPSGHAPRRKTIGGNLRRHLRSPEIDRPPAAQRLSPAHEHELLVLDKDPNDKTPGHFPVSWCHAYGQGRVFYTSLGHREDIWDTDPALPGRVAGQGHPFHRRPQPRRARVDVNLRRRGAGMPEQPLDHVHLRPGISEVAPERVPALVRDSRPEVISMVN